MNAALPLFILIKWQPDLYRHNLIISIISCEQSFTVSCKKRSCAMNLKTLILIGIWVVFLVRCTIPEHQEIVPPTKIKSNNPRFSNNQQPISAQEIDSTGQLSKKLFKSKNLRDGICSICSLSCSTGTDRGLYANPEKCYLSPANPKSRNRRNRNCSSKNISKRKGWWNPNH